MATEAIAPTFAETQEIEAVDFMQRSQGFLRSIQQEMKKKNIPVEVITIPNESKVALQMENYGILFFLLPGNKEVELGFASLVKAEDGSVSGNVIPTGERKVDAEMLQVASLLKQTAQFLENDLGLQVVVRAATQKQRKLYEFIQRHHKNIHFRLVENSTDKKRGIKDFFSTNLVEEVPPTQEI